MNDSGNPFDSPRAQAMDIPPRQSVSSWKSWVGAFLCIFIAFSFVVSLSLPSLSTPRWFAQRMQSQNNLKQIGLALLNYHDTYGSLPPAMVTDANGKPLYSWRVLVLPFVEEQALYDQFALDEPWDSPTNLPLLKPMPIAYGSPFPETPDQETKTPYLALVDTQNQRTAMLPTRGRTFRELTDGPSNTGMVICDLLRPVPWSAPEDRDPLDLLARKTFQDIENQTLHLVLGDARVRFLTDEQRPDLLGYLFCNDGRVPKKEDAR